MKKNSRKLIILDTNIIIRDPMIITRWSPMIDLIVPDVVENELFDLSRRDKISKNIINLWEESGYKQFIKGTTTDNTDISNSGTYKNLSKTDLILAHYVKEIIPKSKVEVYLATEDRRLQEYCQIIGVQVLRLSDVQSLFLKYETTEMSELKTTEKIEGRQKKLLIKWLFSFVIIFLCLSTILYYQNEITNYYNGTLLPILQKHYKVIIPIALPIIGLVLYWFRSLQRALYGIVETGIGTIGSIFIFAFNDNQQSMNSVAIISIIGSIYVVVRGLDNFYQGIKGTKIEPIIRWVLMEKGKK